MATAKVRTKKQAAATQARPAVSADLEVLTLAEAAAYLRVAEEEVLRMVRAQDQPS